MKEMAGREPWCFGHLRRGCSDEGWADVAEPPYRRVSAPRTTT